MRPRPLLGFAGVDPSYRGEFLSHHASLVPPQRLAPFLDFLLAGAAPGEAIFRIADIIRSGTSSPAYKRFTGEGPATEPSEAERRAVDAAILEATHAGCRHLFLDRRRTPHWPDGETELFRVAADLPQGLTQIAQARVPKQREHGGVVSVPGRLDKARLLRDLIHGIRRGKHRAPVLTVDTDEEFVDAVLAAMLRVTPQQEWTGRVSEYQSIDSFTTLGVTQPAKADNVDVGDLLDSSVALPDGSSFACSQGSKAVLIAYREASSDDCYLQVSRIREGASRDDLLGSVRTRAAELETMPDTLDALELHRYYAVSKDMVAAVEPRYAYPLSLLLLAAQYPLYVVRQRSTLAPELPDLDRSPRAPELPNLDLDLAAGESQGDEQQRQDDGQQ